MPYILILISSLMVWNSLFSIEMKSIEIPEVDLKQNYFTNINGEVAGVQNAGFVLFFWSPDYGYIKIPFAQEVKSLGHYSEISDYRARIIHFSDKGTILMEISYSRKKIWKDNKNYILAGWSMADGFNVFDNRSSSKLVNYKYIGNNFIQLELVDKHVLYKFHD